MHDLPTLALFLVPSPAEHLRDRRTYDWGLFRSTSCLCWLLCSPGRRVTRMRAGISQKGGRIDSISADRKRGACAVV